MPQNRILPSDVQGRLERAFPAGIWGVTGEYLGVSSI